MKDCASNKILHTTALAVTAAALVLPASAMAASVEVSEPVGSAVLASSSNLAKLTFRGAGSEANHVRFVYTGGNADHFGVEVIDTGAGVIPGPGCSGGGSPGVAVQCLIHRYHQTEYTYCGHDCVYPIPGSGWRVEFEAVLGNGGSFFEMPPLPPAGEEPIPITVIGGAGDDEILTGNGNDTIEPGMGHDQVHAGEGSDKAIATSVPDGPDFYDLGPGFYNWLTYEARSAPVIFRAESPDEVGAPGEGDKVRYVTSVSGGSGDDILEANAEAKYFLGGGPGNDQLVGGSQNDTLKGGPGNDRYQGGAGNDEITEGIANHAPQLDGANEENYADGGTGNDIIALNAGPDRAVGGPGNDIIRMGAGPDVANGGPGDDTILGDDGNDSIDGEEGDDWLVGGRGADQLRGGSGDDRIVAAVDYRGGYEPEITSLTPPGAVDGWADTIDCDGGTDFVSLNPWDTAQQCERRILVQALEIGGTKVNRRTGITWLRVGVRSGGTLKLRGIGVQRVTKRPKYSTGSLWLPVRPRGHALHKLQSSRKVRLRLKLTFRPEEGIARTRLHLIRLAR